LRPVTLTTDPMGPLDGDAVSVGVSDVARAPPSGITSAIATRIIDSVAIASRHCVGLGLFGGRRGSRRRGSTSQRLPSQNDIRWLHSATRLTR
jgi:hypothetical protein